MSDFYDRIAAALGAAADAAADLDAANTVLAADADTLRADNAVLRADNATLAQALADCRAGTTPPVPDPEPVTLFGTSRPDQALPPGTVALPVPGIRTYLQPGQMPTALAQNAGLARAYGQVPADGGVVWFSIKEQAGSWLASLLADVAAKHPGVTTMLTADHEPRDGWWAVGKYDQWKARQAALEAVAAGLPGVELWTVVEGSSVALADSYWYETLREAQGFAIDSYNPGIGKPKSYVPPAEVHGPRLDWIRAHGRTPAVGETGTGITAADTTRAGQEQWAADNAAFLAAQQVRAAFWWNSGTDGPASTGTRLRAAALDRWLGR